MYTNVGTDLVKIFIWSREMKKNERRQQGEVATHLRRPFLVLFSLPTTTNQGEEEWKQQQIVRGAASETWSIFYNIYSQIDF